MANWYDDPNALPLEPEATLPATVNPNPLLSAYQRGLAGLNPDGTPVAPSPALPGVMAGDAGMGSSLSGLNQYLAQKPEKLSPEAQARANERFKSRAAIQPPKKAIEAPLIWGTDTLAAAKDWVGGLGTTVPAALYRLQEGDTRPDQYSPEAKAAFAAEEQLQQQSEAERLRREQAGESTQLGSAIREAIPSSGFSVGSMAAAIPAGLATGAATQAAIPVPGSGVVGGVIGSFAGSGAAAFQMARSTAMDEWFKQAEAGSLAKNKRPLTEPEKQQLYEELQPLATDSGLWEAGPEALGNAFMLVGGGLATGLIGKAAFRKATMGAMKKAGIRAGAAAVGAGMEFGTETTTELGQATADARAEVIKNAIAEGRPIDPKEVDAAVSRYNQPEGGGVVRAFKDIAAPTLGTMVMFGLAGGAVKGGQKAYERLVTNPQDAKAILEMASSPEVLSAMPESSLRNLESMTGHLQKKWFQGDESRAALEQVKGNLSAELASRSGESADLKDVRQQTLRELWEKMAPPQQQGILAFLGNEGPGLTGYLETPTDVNAPLVDKEGNALGDIDVRGLRKLAPLLGLKGAELKAAQQRILQQRQWYSDNAQPDLAADTFTDDQGVLWERDLATNQWTPAKTKAAPPTGLGEIPPAPPTPPDAPVDELEELGFGPAIPPGTPPALPPPLPTPPAEGPPASTAGQIQSAFDALASGANEGARRKVRDDLQSGNPPIYRNPAAIVAAKANPNYSVEDLPDGTVRVIGVLDPDTQQWAGTPRVSTAPSALPAPTPATPTPGETIQLQRGESIELTPPKPGEPVTRTTTTPEEQARLQGLMGERPTRAAPVVEPPGLSSIPKTEPPPPVKVGNQEVAPVAEGTLQGLDLLREQARQVAQHNTPADRAADLLGQIPGRIGEQQRIAQEGLKPRTPIEATPEATPVPLIPTPTQEAPSAQPSKKPVWEGKSKEELESSLQMYDDAFEIKKRKKEEIPQEWIDNYGAIKQVLRGEEPQEGLSPLIVPGHPEHPLTNTSPLFRYGTVPLKVTSLEQVNKRLSEANEAVSSASESYYSAKYQLDSAKTAAEKKKANQAIQDLANQGITEDAILAFRNETIPELNRLYREMKKRTPSPTGVDSNAQEVQAQTEAPLNQGAPAAEVAGEEAPTPATTSTTVDRTPEATKKPVSPFADVSDDALLDTLVNSDTTEEQRTAIRAEFDSRAQEMSKTDKNIGREWHDTYGKRKIIGIKRGSSEFEYVVEGQRKDGSKYTSTRRMKDIDRAIQSEETVASPEFQARQNQQKEARQKEESEKALRDQETSKYVDALDFNLITKESIKRALSVAATYQNESGNTVGGDRASVVRAMLEDGSQPKAVDVPAMKEISRSRYNRMDGYQQAEYEKKRAAAGTKTEYRMTFPQGRFFVVTKTEYDYAQWLMGNKEKSVEQADPFTPATPEERQATQRGEMLADPDFKKAMIDYRDRIGWAVKGERFFADGKFIGSQSYMPHPDNPWWAESKELRQAKNLSEGNVRAALTKFNRGEAPASAGETALLDFLMDHYQNRQSLEEESAWLEDQLTAKESDLLDRLTTELENHRDFGSDRLSEFLQEVSRKYTSLTPAQFGRALILTYEAKLDALRKAQSSGRTERAAEGSPSPASQGDGAPVSEPPLLADYSLEELDAENAEVKRKIAEDEAQKDQAQEESLRDKEQKALIQDKLTRFSPAGMEELFQPDDLLAGAKEAPKSDTVDLAEIDASRRKAMLNTLEKLGWERAGDGAKLAVGGGTTGGELNPTGKRTVHFEIAGGQLRAYFQDGMEKTVTVATVDNAENIAPQVLARKLHDQVMEKTVPAPKPEAQKQQGKAPSSASAPLSGFVDLANRVKVLLLSGSATPLTSPALFRMADAAFGGTQAQGTYNSKDAYDAMELGVNLALLEQPMNWGFQQANSDALKSALTYLEALQQRLPTQSKRDEEQIAMQQFSTPHIHAHVVAWVANIAPTDVVLEPTAGTGNLVTHAQLAKPQQVIANELSERRSTLLKEIPGVRTFTENANHLNAILPADVKPTVVVMNPPFSADINKVGKKDLMVAAKQIEQALARLQPNGRLVAIVGRGMSFDAETFKDWWNTIQKQYRVRANIAISGKEYTKFGTSFDNRILVIDKTGQTGLRSTIVEGDVAKVADLIPLLEAIRRERVHQATPAGQSQPTSVASPQGATRPGSVPAPGVNDQGDGTGTVGGTVRDATGRARRYGGRADTVGEDAALRGAAIPDGKSGEPRAVRAGSSGDDAAQGVRAIPAVDAAGQPAGIGDYAQPAEPVLEIEKRQAPAKENAALSDKAFEGYQPEATIKGAKPHPTPLVESAAMSAVRFPPLQYVPNLPVDVVESGALSAAQLEAIAYAGQAHSQLLPNGERRGFFIGDSTGVGKGAEIAGVIVDNWRNGRKKAVWVSENGRLFPSAQRDADWVGLGKEHLFQQGAIKGEIQNKEGVLYTTYATLRNAEKGDATRPGLTRLDQLVNWLGKDFDGVIAFDEAHNMGNATDSIGSRGRKEASAAALAGIDLQKRLPKARVIYVSATGATEVDNLVYAQRLGLWGEGTAFADAGAFVNEISSGGLAAMEVVAKDMKSFGLYTARSLSWDGVVVEPLQHSLSPEQAQMYDELARSWQVVLQDIGAAMSDSGSDKNGMAKGQAMGAFWGAHQRFFNAILTSLSVPSLIKDVETQIAAGHSVVMQLVNTNEATQERRKAQAADAGLDLSEVDITPRDILMQYLQNSFPTALYEDYTDENGNVRSRPVTDSAGQVVQNPSAVARRDALMEKLGALSVPEGVLEQVINHFGSKAIAEITGRKSRLVRQPDGKVIEEKLSPAKSNADASAFDNDDKRILVFSDAGGTGRSYHADRRFKNQRLRVHYLVQPGWRADKAIQGLGRTHRTNQAQPPLIKTVTTNIKSQLRFVSSIARRMDQMGALTKGQRDANSQGMFEDDMNLENRYSEHALETLFLDIRAGRVDGVTLQDIENQMGLRLVDNNGNFLADKIPTIQQFLNRLLSLDLEMMERVFDAFDLRRKANIEYAKQNGNYDAGMETLKALSIIQEEEKEVARHPGGGTTQYVKLVAEHENRFIGYDVLAKTAIFARNRQSGKLYAFEPAISITNPKTGEMIERSRRFSPYSAEYKKASEVYDANKYEILEGSDAKKRKAWEQAIKDSPQTSKETIHLITGALLPVWDRLDNASNRVIRAQTDQGKVLIGRQVKGNDIAAVLKKLGVQSDAPQLTAQQALDQVMQKGSTLILSNDWKIERRTVNSQARIELVGANNVSDVNLLKTMGAFAEVIQFKTRVFLPTDRADILERIIKSKPIIEVLDKQGAPITLPKPQASRTPTPAPGLSRTGFVAALQRRFPHLSEALNAMLARGEKNQKGGLVLVNSIDQDTIARVFAAKTGRSLESARQEIQASRRRATAFNANQSAFDLSSEAQVRNPVTLMTDNASSVAPIQESDEARKYRESVGYARIIRVNAAALQAEFEQQNNEKLVHKPLRVEKLREYATWDAHPLVGITPYINRLSITDGRHRIAVAAERGQEIDIAVPEDRAAALQAIFGTASNRDTEYLAAVERGDLETAQRMVTEAAEAAGVPVISEEGVTAYKVRRNAPPKKTVKAYKLFRVKSNQKGEVFALFVGANDPLPQDVWLDAIAGPGAGTNKSGGPMVKSKLGPLSFRPGWHAGDIPLATHIGAKQSKSSPIMGRKEDEVWAEVDVAADDDGRYQKEADKNGTRPDGRFVVGDADIKYMPENGMYRYKTNPNMTGQWIISGSMKINRILSENEVNELIREAGLGTMPWTINTGAKVNPYQEAPLDLARWGLGTNPAVNQKKLLDPVTYDDAGNVIPLSQRFDKTKQDVRFSKDGVIQGIYDPQTGITFAILPNLSEASAPGVFLHENVHAQQRADIDARAVELVNNREQVKRPELRTLLNRVQARLEASSATNDPKEVSAYLIEELAATARLNGMSAADGKFLDWVDRTLGQSVGDWVRSIVKALRGWAFRHGLLLKASQLSLDDLMAWAEAGVQRTAAGKVKLSTAGAMARGEQPGAAFYSALTRAIQDLSQKKAPGSQWASILENLAKKGQVKQEELDWTGTLDWLREQKTLVPKEDVLAFVRSNEVRVEETELGKAFSDQMDKIGQWEFKKHNDKISAWTWTRIGGEIPFVSLLSFDGGNSWTMHGSKYTVIPQSILNATYESADDAKEAVMPSIASFHQPNIETRNTEWTFDETADSGSQRELILTVPTIEPWSTDDETHYGDVGGGRAVAWVRFNTRTDEDGKQVLFIEEIQSKRHQEGREKGYWISQWNKEKITNNDRFTIFYQEKLNTWFVDDAQSTGIIGSGYSKEEAISNAIRELDKKEYDGKTPNAPFKQTIAGSGSTLSGWAGLAFKRMLRYAAENGYERLAWTTGKQQAERYNLGQKVSRIDYTEASQHLRILDRNGMVALEDNIPKEKLPEYLGSELTKQLFKEESKRSYKGVFTGSYRLDFPEGAVIGGEGMKGFYDRLLPNEVNKYVKKWGAQVGQTAINTGTAVEPVHSVEITPDMVASVMKGQPLFSRTLTADELLAQVQSGQVDSLTPDQWAQVQQAFLQQSTEVVAPTGTQAPSFKTWFGASKIKNKAGQPLAMYHATNAEFTVFDSAQSGQSTTHPTAALGFFFTNDQGHAAAQYGNNVMEVYLAIEKPYPMTDADLRKIDTLEDAKAFRQKLEAQGYDGIVMPAETRTRYVAAFHADQIKRTDNQTYTKGEKDIRFSQPQTPAQVGVSASEITKTLIQPKLAAWNEAGLSVEVVQSVADLPADLRARLNDDLVEGFYETQTGKVYLIADQLSSMDRAKEVLQHEALGHWASHHLRAAPEFVQILKALNRLEAVGNKDIVAIAAQVDATQPGLDRFDRAEEIYSVAIERGLHEKIGLLRTWSTKLLQQVKAWLRKLGFDGRFVDEMTLNDVMLWAKESQRRLDQGGKESYGKWALAGSRGVSTSFAGEKAKTADLSLLQQAMARVHAGEDAEQVRQDTGWHQGADTKWRFEIDDSRADWKIPFAQIPESELFKQEHLLPLTDVLDHPELFAAYPQLEKITVVKRAGLFDFGGLQGWFNDDTLQLGLTPYAKDPLSTLLHEVQHVVQMYEGFAKGGNENSAWQALPQETKENIAKGALEKLNKKAVEFQEAIAAVDVMGRHPARIKELQQAENARDYAYTVYKQYKDLPKNNKKRIQYTAEWMKATENALLVKQSIVRLLGFENISDLSLLPQKVYSAVSNYARLLTQSYPAATFTATFQEPNAAIKDYINSLNQDLAKVMEEMAKIKSGDEEAIRKQSNLFEFYKKLAGETEARLTQARQRMTANERRTTSPKSMQEYSDEDQIIVDQATGAAMSVEEQTESERQMAAVRAQYEGTDQWMKAPNGKPTKLNERQWLQVRTPNFLAFFGDWMNDPKNASQVVDKNGEPAVYYRMTDSDRTEFRKSWRGGLIYFAATPQGAEKATRAGSGATYPVFLNAKNIRGHKGPGVYFGDAEAKGYEQKLIKSGFDAVKVRDEASRNGGTLAVLDPTQIKSAIGNTGAFSLTNPDIRFSRAIPPNQYEDAQGNVQDSQAFTPISGRAELKEQRDIVRRLREDGFWKTLKTVTKETRPAWLKLLTLQQKVEMLQDIQGVKDLATLFENTALAMDADKSNLKQEAFALAEEMRSEMVKARDKGYLLGRILQWSSLKNVVPYKVPERIFFATTAEFVEATENYQRLMEMVEKLKTDHPALLALYDKIMGKGTVDANGQPQPNMIERMDGLYRTALQERLGRQALMFLNTTLESAKDTRAQTLWQQLHGLAQRDPAAYADLQQTYQAFLAVTEPTSAQLAAWRDSLPPDSAVLWEELLIRDGRMRNRRSQQMIRDMLAAAINPEKTPRTGTLTAALRTLYDQDVNAYDELRDALKLRPDFYRPTDDRHTEIKDRLPHSVQALFEQITTANNAAVAKVSLNNKLEATKTTPPAQETSLTGRLHTLFLQSPERFAELSKALRTRLQTPEMDAAEVDALRSRLLEPADQALFDELAADMRAKVQPGLTALRELYESRRQSGPYFPLDRFGPYQVYAERAGNGKDGIGLPAFSTFETEAEQQRAVQRMQAEGWTVRTNYQIRDALETAAPPNSFIKKMFNQIDQTEMLEAERQTLKNDIYQMYLQSLPELSARKHFMKRKGIPGFSGDALRSFAQLMNSKANAIARLRHSDQLTNALESMEKASKAMGQDPTKLADQNRARMIIEELKDSYSWMMNPSNATWANRLTSLGFFWYLTNISTALVNLTQVPIWTFPELGAKFGAGRSFAALNKTIAEYGVWKLRRGETGRKLLERMRGEFNGELGLDLDRVERDGIVTRTQAVTLAGMGEDAPEFKGGAAGSAAAAWEKTFKVVSWPFHKTEVANREISFITAYRLARTSEQAQAKVKKMTADGATPDAINAAVREYAYETARNVVLKTQGNYANYNRAPFMRSNIMRVATLFRSYSQMMTWRLLRDTYQAFKSANPQEKTEVKKRLWLMLASSFLWGGAMGLPIYTVAMSLAGLLFGNDPDDPYEPEVAMKQALQGLLGETGQQALMGGVVGQLPKMANLIPGIDGVTGIDLAPRVSADLVRLWMRRMPGDLEGESAWDWYVMQMMGPIAGMGRNAFRAYGDLVSSAQGGGSLFRALEGTMPAPVRNILKAARFEEEGVTTRRGDLLVPDMNWAMVVQQAVGFTPDTVAAQYAQNTARYEFKDALQKRRKGLTDRYIFSLHEKDDELRKETLEFVKKFNRLNPETPITAQSLKAAYGQWLRARQLSEGGVYEPSQGMRARLKREFAEEDEE